jgi:hypothetical protein
MGIRWWKKQSKERAESLRRLKPIMVCNASKRRRRRRKKKKVYSIHISRA